ncbi:563_t:CDS:2 [Racocetra fulgida]|uniref:563_t:CDS:1 n=1 Tax=Racocetra fulgida TaxID=60492 RepID=A0A9N9FFC8_9GLOM|nr:563_t:CDS:2 [Racocetra fulgida]
MSDTDWNKFKVPELKAKCKELGLHVSGTKKTLIERILSYYHVDPNQTKNVEKVLQKPDKREVSDNIEASQRKSKRIDDDSRSEITFSDGLTCLSEFPVIRNIESPVSSTEETQDNLTAIPVTVETSPTQDDASEFSKSYSKKTLFVNTKINTKIPSQNAFNTDPNLNQLALSNVISKVSRPHSINTNTNKNTPLNLSHRSSAFRETGKPKRQKIHHVIHKQNNIKNYITKPNNMDLASNQTQPILFPLIQIPQDVSHHEIRRIEMLTSCLERTDFQTVLAAEHVCRLWKCAGYIGLIENMPCILDADEIIDEIWKIRLVNSDELMILGATGEVIGHGFDNIRDNNHTQEPSRIGWSTLKNWIAAELHYGEVKEQLRVDWATYICSKSQFIPDKNKEYILPSTIDNSPVLLINKVITENENYPNSIHKSITFESTFFRLLNLLRSRELCNPSRT